MPPFSNNLSRDDRYFALISSALHKCAEYRPRFGAGSKARLSLDEFIARYASDPFYHWFGVDSPLMYAAHKAAGGMTSIYRQIGIGCQRVFQQVLQDQLDLTAEQTAWSYAVESSTEKGRKLQLDGRIALDDLGQSENRQRIESWLEDTATVIGLPPETLPRLRGIVFEVRQGYKSKDSKRQNADIMNATKAYAHLYLPVILLLSTQIDSDVAKRYRENLWLILTGTTVGPTTASTYSFCRDILGYDLARFFEDYSDRIKAEVESMLDAFLRA